jgi:hypothetical protein
MYIADSGIPREQGRVHCSDLWKDSAYYIFALWLQDAFIEIIPDILEE